MSDGWYSSKWGLTDLYPESEAKLREILESGEDFCTNWEGCKKEIRYARYVRAGGIITVQVSAHMDDLWESDDLIYDALWEEFKSEDELPDEVIQAIRECLGDVDDVSYETVELPGTASFEEVMKATAEAEDKAEQKNYEMFRELCAAVRECVGEYRRES